VASAELPPLPSVIAHRGASGVAPENTLSAVRIAAEQGAGWVEVDVMVSRDGQAVIHHDDRLGRCNDGRGWVLATELAELRELDAGRWFAPEFAGERIPTLADMVETVLALDLGFNLEIKATEGWEEPTAEAAMDVLEHLWPGARPLLVSSFSERVLALVARRLPGVPIAYNVTAVPPDWEARLASLGAVSLHCHHRANLTGETVAAIRDAGYGLLCFTVNQPEDARRVLGWGANAVFSDLPGDLVRELGP
jgi:glycerophosphoryl diester phosphodiesterase